MESYIVIIRTPDKKLVRHRTGKVECEQDAKDWAIAFYPIGSFIVSCQIAK